MAQLKENLAAFERPLDAELLAQIEEIRRRYPAPF
jgi:aryl-alcohol dehydrogenase-like predicted oxidoreductase